MIALVTITMNGLVILQWLHWKISNIMIVLFCNAMIMFQSKLHNVCVTKYFYDFIAKCYTDCITKWCNDCVTK